MVSGVLAGEIAKACRCVQEGLLFAGLEGAEEAVSDQPYTPAESFMRASAGSVTLGRLLESSTGIR
jgi:hypothetical protein